MLYFRTYGFEGFQLRAIESVIFSTASFVTSTVGLRGLAGIRTRYRAHSIYFIEDFSLAPLVSVQHNKVY